MLLLPCACRRGDQPAPQRVASSSILRLLPAIDAEVTPVFQTAPRVIADLADWQFIAGDFFRPRMQPATAVNCAVDGNGVRVIQPRGGALVRLIELPPGCPYEVLFTFAGPAPPDDGDACRRATALALQPLGPGRSVADVLRAGVSLEDGEPLRVEQVIARFGLRQALRGDARWSAASDRAQATAKLTLPQVHQRSAFALIIVFADQAPALNSVAVYALPDPNAPAHSPAPGITQTSVSLGGELRSCATVPGGDSLDIRLTVPARVDGIALGVAGAAGASFSIDVRRIRAATADPPADAGRIVHALQAHAERVVLAEGIVGRQVDRFDDRWVPWLGPREGEVLLSLRATSQQPVVFASPVIRSKPEGRSPNLLFISLDTLRADHLGCYGYPRDTSPFLDRFARTATRFTHFRAVAPFTLPTHASLFTGLYPPRHGALDNDRSLNADAIAYLPRLLANAGYATAAFTGGGLVSPAFGFAAGFDRFGTIDPVIAYDDVSPDPTRAGRDIDAARQWIEGLGDQPWFAFLHTFMVHEYAPPRELLAVFDRHPDRQWQRDPRTLLDRPAWTDDPPTTAELEFLIDCYDATIRYADQRLQHLFEQLREIGALTDTVVVITADHGEEFFEHGRLRHAASLQEEMLWVPLLIQRPGQAAGATIAQPVTQVDVMPTLLALLGLDCPPDLDGRDLSPWLRGERSADAAGPGSLYAQIATSHSRRAALRVGRLKVIRGDTDPSLPYPAPHEWRMFDLANDPLEKIDLSAQRPADLERMKRLLAATEAGLNARAVKSGEAHLDAELLDRLRELGYIR